MASNFIDPNTFIDPNEGAADAPEATPEKTPISAMVRRGFKSAAANARPYLQTGGAVLGGVIAAPEAAASGPLAPVVEAAGIATGHWGGTQLANALEQVAGVEQPFKHENDLARGARETLESAEQGVLGPVFSKGVQLAGKVVGKVGSAILGRFSGAGAGAVETAVEAGRTLKGNVFKSQTAYDMALRGRTGDSQIVETATDALTRMKNNRATAYIKKLEELLSPTVTPAAPGVPGKVSPPPLRRFTSLKPLRDKIDSIMKEANVLVNRDGTLDFSRTNIGEEGVRTLKAELETARSWGAQGPQIARLKIAAKDLATKVSKTTDPVEKKKLQEMLTNTTTDLKDLQKKYAYDNSPLGLDTLKRRLDDYWSPSSNARAFVTKLRGKVNDMITESVPEYAEMTKGYREATELIKDVEQSFAVGDKFGVGRSGTDRALKRMMDVMRRDDATRKELLDIMSKKPGGNEDLQQMIAGKLMNPYLPKSNLVMFGEIGLTAMKFWERLLNPEWMMIVAASSPRIQGEFLRLMGAGLEATAGGSKILGQAAAVKLYGGKRPEEMSDDEIKAELDNALGIGKEAVKKAGESETLSIRKPEEKKKKTFGRSE